MVFIYIIKIYAIISCTNLSNLSRASINTSSLQAKDIRTYSSMPKAIPGTIATLYFSKNLSQKSDDKLSLYSNFPFSFYISINT